jgi:glutathione S-transferase
MSQHFPAIITLLTLFLFLCTAAAVAFARHKYKIPAPATTGNENFERIFRVQMNTLENIVIFLPALWMFAIFVSFFWAGIVGLIWILARVDYAISYSRSAAARERGFGISLAAFAVLAIGAAVGICIKMFAA